MNESISRIRHYRQPANWDGTYPRNFVSFWDAYDQKTDSPLIHEHRGKDGCLLWTRIGFGPWYNVTASVTCSTTGSSLYYVDPDLVLPKTILDKRVSVFTGWLRAYLKWRWGLRGGLRPPLGVSPFDGHIYLELQHRRAPMMRKAWWKWRWLCWKVEDTIYRWSGLPEFWELRWSRPLRTNKAARVSLSRQKFTPPKL